MKTFVLDGKKVTVKLCTNCIKLYKKIDREKKEALVAKAEASPVPTTILS